MLPDRWTVQPLAKMAIVTTSRTSSVRPLANVWSSSSTVMEMTTVEMDQMNWDAVCITCVLRPAIFSKQAGKGALVTKLAAFSKVEWLCQQNIVVSDGINGKAVLLTDRMIFVFVCCQRTSLSVSWSASGSVATGSAFLYSYGVIMMMTAETTLMRLTVSS